MATKRRLTEPVKSSFSPKTMGTFRMYREPAAKGEYRAPEQVRGPVKAAHSMRDFRDRLIAIKQSFRAQR